LNGGVCRKPVKQPTRKLAPQGLGLQPSAA
jgi:hypothetical protein